MGAVGHCNSCDSKRSIRRVELLVESQFGGMLSLSVRLCGPCTIALLEQVQLHAVMVPLPGT